MSRALEGALKQKVRKQIEFYFSDSNAPRDTFLMEKIKSHPEGYVELAVICAFSRMANALGLPLAQKPQEVPVQVIKKVAEAIEDSPEVEVSKEKMHVRRRKPLQSQEKLCREIDERSIYAKPLPFDCTLENLTTFFNTVGNVKAVRLRRRPVNKDFKGSIFVELESPEVAEKVAAKEDLVYEGAPLRMEKKIDYMERKKSSRKANKDTHMLSPTEMVSGQDCQQSNGSGAPQQPVAQVPNFEPGLVVQFNILPANDVPPELHYTAIKEAFGGKEGGAVYVEYMKGARQGCVRFSNSTKLEEALKRKNAEGHFLVSSTPAEVKILDGEAEKQFYCRQAEARKRADHHKASGGGSMSGDKRRQSSERGRGGRFGKRGRMV